MLQTADPKGWDIKCDYFKIDKEDDGLKFSSLVRFDPGLPYLYLP